MRNDLQLKNNNFKVWLQNNVFTTLY